MGVKYNFIDKKIDFSGYFNANELYEISIKAFKDAGYKDKIKEEELNVSDEKQLKKKIEFEKKINSIIKIKIVLKINFKFKPVSNYTDKKVHDGSASFDIKATKEIDYDNNWSSNTDKMAFRILLYKFFFKKSIDSELKTEENNIDTVLSKIKTYLGLV